MVTRPGTLALLTLVLLLASCTLERNREEEPPPPDDDDTTTEEDDDDSTPPDPTDDDDDDDDTPPPLEAIIVEVSPEPGEDDFFGGADLFVEFDRAPEEVTLSLFDEGGEQLAGTTTTLNAGRLFVFNPDGDLAPESEFRFRISWFPSDFSPLDIEFATSLHGLPLVDPADLVGLTFVVDPSTGTFIEPPGVGAIIQSQLDGMRMLMEATDDSLVDPADQPGIHALFANAEEFGGDVTQEPCALTSVLTAGEDGEVGTADDQPATLTDPEIILGPADLDFGVLQGTSVPMLDSIMGGTFGPDLDDLAGGFFTGVMDTRPLDETLDPDGGEGAVCNLMAETVGVFCEECGAPNPGEFCLTITVVDLVNEVIAEPSIVPTGCADIIDAWEMDSECPDEAAVYDPAGDGSYSDCPSWPSR